jgi:hypothetical protein
MFEIPLTLWTDFVVSGRRVYIRTRRRRACVAEVTSPSASSSS